MAAGSPTPSLISPSLRRELGVWTATSVVIANMIGTGIFTTTGLMLAEVRSPGLVLLCWLAGGILALCGALSYAELAAMWPRAGGEYVYLREIYGPLPAFLTGWISFFVGFSAPVAAGAISAATYLHAAGFLPPGWLAEKSAALLLVIALTAVHSVGLRIGARTQNTLTALKLFLLCSLIFAGFLIGTRAGDADFTLAYDAASGHRLPVGLVMLWVMFAYSGWNAAAYLAEDVRDPARTLPRSLFAGTAVVALLYLAMNLLYFYAAPSAALSGQLPVGEIAARHLFGPAAARWYAVLVAVALVSSLSAFILIGPRVYFAMARDSRFFPAAALLHPRTGTPVISLAAQCLCACAMVLTGTFDQLLTYIGFALGIFPLLAVFGVFVMRRRAPALHRPWRVWGYPVVPAVFLLGMSWILLAAFLNRPGPPLVALATLAAGALVYRLLFR